MVGWGRRSLTSRPAAAPPRVRRWCEGVPGTLAHTGIQQILAVFAASGVLKVTVYWLQSRSHSLEATEVACFQGFASAAAAEADAVLMDGHQMGVPQYS